MATLAIVLNTTKKLSNHEYSVALRVTQNRIRKYYAISNLVTDQTLNFKCKPNNWKPAAAEDNGLGRFLSTVKDFKLLNQKLAEKMALAQQILNTYDFNPGYLTWALGVLLDTLKVDQLYLLLLLSLLIQLFTIHLKSKYP